MCPGLYSQPDGERRPRPSGRPLGRHAESWLQPSGMRYSLRKGEALFCKLRIAERQKRAGGLVYGNQTPLLTGSAAATTPAKGLPSSTRSMVSRLVSADEKSSPR